MIKRLMAVALAAQIVLGIGPAKVQAEDIAATNALTIDSASQITEMVADERAQNRVNTGPHVFAAVTASGTWGTCPWSVSSDGVLTIGAGTGVSTNGEGSAPWYSQHRNIKSVKITGEVKLPQSVQYLFELCGLITTLDLSSFDTSAVTDMSYMFDCCYHLTTLDLSSWDTSAVTDMSYMFNNCRNLTTLNVSSWDTSAVTNMESMFNACDYLTALDVSHWDTGAVTNMSSMFNFCTDLTTLDVSGWDTSSVTDMNSLFCDCHSLTTLNVSKWSTSKVTGMSAMFYDCNLTTLDASNWDTSAVTTMGQMFAECDKLTALDISSWDTSKVTRMDYMLDYCDNLAYIKIGSGFVTSANIDYLFPTPSKTISGKVSSGTWGLGSEAAAKQYTAEEFTALGKTPGALTGIWYAQVKRELTFISWNTKPDGSGITYMPGDPLPDMNMDLYAQWGIAYKIAYDLDGGENNSANPSMYAPGQRTITLAAPTKRGYKFTGWTGSNGNTAQQNVSITGSDTGDKTYKANWEPITYTVRFNTTGMPLKPIPDMICTYDVHYTPPMIEETDPNHSMAGYFIDFTGYSVDPLLPGAMAPSYHYGMWSTDIYNLSDVDGDVVTLTPTAKVYKVDDQGNFIPIN